MNTDITNYIDRTLKKQEQSAIFWEEMAIIGFTEAVLERMESAGISKKDLAERMNVSAAYITKLMGGSNNFTLRTMVNIARSLGSELHFDLRKPLGMVNWQKYNAVIPCEAMVMPRSESEENPDQAKFKRICLALPYETLPAAA